MWLNFLVVLVVVALSLQSITASLSSQNIQQRKYDLRPTSISSLSTGWLSRVLMKRGGSTDVSVEETAPGNAENIFGTIKSSNPLVNQLYEQFEQAKDIDDIFEIMEEIPAIKKSVDRAMKIPSAQLDDALLAIHALSRIAHMISSLFSTELDSATLATINNIILDRRMEQLVECVELQMNALAVEDLSKYLWSLVMIDMEDHEEYIKPVIEEFQERLRVHLAIDSGDIKEGNGLYRLTSDNFAMMLWALGCVKDRYGVIGAGNTHEGLFDKLASNLMLSSCSTTCKDPVSCTIQLLTPKLVVRLLWSLAIVNANHPDYKLLCGEGLEASVKQLSSLSSTNKVSLLWCAAQFGVLSKGSTKELLVSLLQHLERNEIPREELLYIIESMRIMSGMARRQFVVLSEEEELQKALEEEERGRRGRANRRNVLSNKMQAQDLLDIIEKIGEMLYYLLDRSVLEMDTLPMSHVTSLFKAAASIEIIRPLVSTIKNNELPNISTNSSCDLMANFVDKCLHRITEEVEGRGIKGCINGKEAANLLEALVSVIDYPALVKREKCRQQIIESKKNVRFGYYDFVDKSVASWDLIQEHPSWHKIAGRLAVISSLNVGEIGDKAQIVAASWAVACLGHSYRPLFRVARRATQYTLHEQSPQTLARLAVSIASEEAASFASGGGMSVKLDHEFVDKVAINALRRANDITSQRELVHAIVSIAFLGRLSSSGTRLQWTLHPTTSSDDSSSNKDDSQNIIETMPTMNAAVVEMTPLPLSYLTTKNLIRLQWAIGRLPVGIFSASTIQNIRQELDQRNISPSTMDSKHKDKLSIKDSFLYVKTLVDSAAIKENDLLHLKDKVCSSLMEHCAFLFNSSQPSTMNQVDPKSIKDIMTEEMLQLEEDSSDTDKAFLMQHKDPNMDNNAVYKGKHVVQDKDYYMVVNPSILIDSIQAMIELNWYNEEMVNICGNFMNNFHLEEEQGLTPHTKLAVSFQHGILRELLKVYKNLPYAKKNSKKNAKNQKQPMQGILSKFFGGVGRAASNAK